MNADDVQRRLDRFSCLAGDIIPDAERSVRLRHYQDQLMRSSSRAGAHYAEAQAAASDEEFVYKLRNSLKEIKESMRWLKYLAYAIRRPLSELQGECDELCAMLYSSVRTASRRAQPAAPPKTSRKRPDAAENRNESAEQPPGMGSDTPW